ncbi:TetR/AcrR family transcriptional regulator [Algihabitans albus]|uniref:TetR/AcrR family transcriptional regulator n=1 Tax=Algihabitans albus TaxID=2164067 RepID=UPI000E5D696D|nr:TetR/AcrR family transcriptional regulator [Algihabitans albus]
MSQAGKARTHAEMIAETAGKLVSAARRSFGAKGYAGTSMDELCAEAGLTRGALYHHFGGKVGLLEAVVREIDAEIGDRLEAHWRGIEDPWEAFRACNTEYLRLALDPEIQRILLRDAPAVLGQRLREIDEDGSIGPLAEALEDLMRAGRIADCDAEVVARLLNGALVDAALWIAAGADAEARFERAAAGIDLILKGLER